MECAAFRLLATTSADGTAKIWRTSDFNCQYELKHDRLQNWVWDCAFTSDSLYLVTGLLNLWAFRCTFLNWILVCSDGKGRLWSTDTGTVEKEYIGHQKPATCLAFDDRPPRWSCSSVCIYINKSILKTICVVKILILNGLYEPIVFFNTLSYHSHLVLYFWEYKKLYKQVHLLCR